MVYADSLSWGIIPNTRERLAPNKRWTGILQESLGTEYKVIEECLNGRTTNYTDPNRPSRNGCENITMLLESHSPLDLVIIFLGINDFQDIIGVSVKESANSFKTLLQKVQNTPLEPSNKPAKVLAIIPPEIQEPRANMKEKFSGFKRSIGLEEAYKDVLETLNIAYIKSSDFISLSEVDGIHLDEAEHKILAVKVLKKVKNLC